MSILMEDWHSCKNILCIRADNIGDLLMSTPAISAVKTTIGCKVTVLTSPKAAGVTPLIPDIDEVIVADLPWVKTDHTVHSPEVLQELILQLRKHAFDGCIIFTVYSQNPLPAAMLAYLSGIPLRLAYCRENPYHFLTTWVPDAEPYSYIRHQVERDLDLVAAIGATTSNLHLRLALDPASRETAAQKISYTGADVSKPYLLLHPGVSEEKRTYPEELWITAGRLLIKEFGMQLLVSGSAAEKALAERISNGIGSGAWSVAGLLNLEEFAMLIRQSEAVVSVNTATIHLASAVNKAVVVLYAQSNPQHTPWLVLHKLLEYSIPQRLRSKNQVIHYVNEQHYNKFIDYPPATAIISALRALLKPEK